MKKIYLLISIILSNFLVIWNSLAKNSLAKIRICECSPPEIIIVFSIKDYYYITFIILLFFLIYFIYKIILWKFYK